MTEPAVWLRARALFERAVELPESERTAFVERETRDEPAVAEEVLSLLRVYREDDDFLDAPAAPLPEGREGPIDRFVGPYRLTRVLGSGGMGVVYEAERADDTFHKRVAIKLVQGWMHSDRMVRRFRRERSILASLDHPNIAHLLDGGVAGDGRPFLVMEYVEGRTLTELCDEEGLGLRERLELFREACGAVHFAHRNLVIHRDLKPSNLLVDTEGRVKLLDFGVAKLLADDHEEFATRLGERVFTPGYASPEQLRGRPVTTATDVYSLGVILYELIAGRHPFEPIDGSPEELVRKMAAGAVPPSRATAHERGPRGALRPGRRRGPVAGELDNIVLTAMREEPDRRYPSAEALAADVGRYLAGHPVAAQPDSAGYRVRKFLQRHRGSVLTACLVALAVFSGGIATAWQARVAERERARAERRFEDVRGLTNALLFDVHDAIADLPGATAARALVVRRAFEYLGRLSAQSEGADDLDREVAEGYLRLGNVLGSPSGASLGDVEAAGEAYALAIEIASRAVAEAPGDRAAMRTLALSLRGRADLLQWSAGGTEEAAATLERSLGLFEQLAAGTDDDVAAHLETVIAHVKLGDVAGHPFFPNLGRPARATEWYERARSLLTEPPLARSDAWNVRRFRGLVDERLGAMHRHAGRLDEAREHFTRSLAVREELAREDPTHLDALRDVAVGHQVLCEVQRGRRAHEEALAECLLARAEFERLRELDPENRQGVTDLARIHHSVSGVLRAAGELEGAEAALERAAVLREGLAAQAPADVPNRTALARLRLELGGIRIDAGAIAAAAEVVELAADELAALRSEGAEVSDEEALLAELRSRLTGAS